MFNIPQDSLPECLTDENKLTVLFAPIRNRSVNPKDFDNKISSWKTIIKVYCKSNDIYTFTVSSLNKVFVRNGRPPSCLPEVIDELEKAGDIQRLEIFLNRDAETWVGWATDIFVKKPVLWSYNILKSSIFTQDKSLQRMVFLDVIKSKCEHLSTLLSAKYGNKLMSLKDVLDILKKTPNDLDAVNLLIHYMLDNNLIHITHLDSVRQNDLETTLFKVGDGTKNRGITEIDIGIYTLETNEKVILTSLEEVEDHIEKCTKEAKMHLAKNHRQLAKSSLQKKRELEKLLRKKADTLNNLQSLHQQIHESRSNAHVWESYKKALSAFDITFKNTGLSEDVIDDTMIKLAEVLDRNRDIQHSLAQPAQDLDESYLEAELAELIKESEEELNTKLEDLSINLPELPNSSPDLTKKTVLEQNQVVEETNLEAELAQLLKEDTHKEELKSKKDNVFSDLPDLVENNANI